MIELFHSFDISFFDPHHLMLCSLNLADHVMHNDWMSTLTHADWGRHMSSGHGSHHHYPRGWHHRY